MKSIFHPQNFIKLFSADQVLRNESETARLLKAFNLSDLDSYVNAANSAVSKQQQHGGVILKRLDPYLTILRSKPRHNFKQ